MLELRKYQQDAVEYVEETGRALLDYGLASGKTETALGLMLRHPDRHHLVVAPKSACKDVWKKRHAKWSLPFRLVYLADSRTQKQKVADLVEMDFSVPSLFVINYSIVSNPNIMKALPNDLCSVTADESHYIKSARAKRSKALYKLGLMADYRMGLSATPMGKPVDLYGQVRFLDWSLIESVIGQGNPLLVRTWDRFQERYCVMFTHNHTRIPTGKYRNLDELHERVKERVMLSVRTRDVIGDELPDEYHVDYPVRLERKARRVYNELKKEFVAELTEGAVSAKNVLVKTIRLRQVVGGTVKNDDGVLQEISTAKRDKLSELIEGSPNHTVVGLVFQEERRFVQEVCESLERGVFHLSGGFDELEEWRESENGVLAVQYQTGAEAIDLSLADVAIMYSHPWSLQTYHQFIGRLIRPDSNHIKATIAHIISTGTIDETIRDSHDSKQEAVDMVMSGNI